MPDKPEVILAIGGHSADMEFTCGPVLAKYTQAGHRAVLLHCTAGEKGHPHKSPEEYGNQKQVEATKAAKVLGAEAIFLGYPGNDFPHNDEVRKAMAAVIRQVRPTIIITHWKGAGHRDHRHAHLNTMDALSYAGHAGFDVAGEPHRVGKIYYTENWEDPHDFAPDVLVDVSDAFDQWHEAAQQYELFRGGVSAFDFDGYYSSLFRLRGCLAGGRYAVGFKKPPRLKPPTIQWL